jgi:hypothetical protein
LFVHSCWGIVSSVLFVLSVEKKKKRRREGKSPAAGPKPPLSLSRGFPLPSPLPVAQRPIGRLLCLHRPLLLYIGPAHPIGRSSPERPLSPSFLYLAAWPRASAPSFPLCSLSSPSLNRPRDPRRASLPGPARQCGPAALQRAGPTPSEP